MAGSQIERALSLLESLTADPGGMPMQTLADQLQIPKSATHRMLAELIRLGYVRQDPQTSRYQLSTKLVALGFRYLANSGADVVQPILDRLAEETGELVRLGVIDGERLTWIAKSQGARGGLRYDPDMGRDAPLSSTASGHAWLASMSDAEALAKVAQQTPIDPAELGPNAPRTEAALLERLRLAREHGYAIMQEVAAITKGAMKMGPGTLYGSIKRMLQAGLIEESDDRSDPELDDQRRRYYRLTGAGRRTLQMEAERLAAQVRLARSKNVLASEY